MIGQCLCPTCGKLVWINDDGALRVHGRRNRRCPGRRNPQKDAEAIGRASEMLAPPVEPGEKR